MLFLESEDMGWKLRYPHDLDLHGSVQTPICGIGNYGENHPLKMPLTRDSSYECLAFGGWSFGEVNNDEKGFIEYVEVEN